VIIVEYQNDSMTIQSAGVADEENREKMVSNDRSVDQS
jgi:hypothetical protein